MEFETDLDALSNSVLDAIEAKKYDEAEKRCQRLLLEFPEVFDGNYRLAQLRTAQKRFREAAEHYSKTLAIIARTPEEFGQELVRDIAKHRDQALAETNQ